MSFFFEKKEHEMSSLNRTYMYVIFFVLFCVKRHIVRKKEKGHEEKRREFRARVTHTNDRNTDALAG